MDDLKLKSTARELLFFCFCLLTLSGKTLGLPNGSGVVRVVVKEGSDAFLPCSLSTKENAEEKLFDWKKDGRKEIFFYVGGLHYNNGRPGQDQQFKGRVSHFQDDLKYGNASIIIRNTKVTDSGDYTCDFPLLQPRQISHIKLVVDFTFRDRSGEISGASPEPSVKTLNQTQDVALLQCEIRGAFPKPTVEWQDSAGNKLPAEEPQVSERGGSFYITVNTTVMKTDHYRCVATQEEIHHHIYAETYVYICDTCSKMDVTGLLSAFVLGALTVATVQALLAATKFITARSNKDCFYLTGAAEERQQSEETDRMTSSTEPDVESNLCSPSDEAAGAATNSPAGLWTTVLNTRVWQNGCCHLFYIK
ncbi:butyrophilin subfamily 3 member A2-like isoform X1 [Micropterus salmoides]|uniref:butyrophilin subfamily 3 member A2-like isoform X1 n=1 Tax=Micropterus salmoides TaxID=27706 RepID=UPI0018ED322F|nr:butyrophilin subfamily 3 member A2-like isoform X1 [Micropterus salmoides]